MSDIDPADALELVCQGLRQQVLPHLHEPHAASTAEAISAVLRALQAELRESGAWREGFVQAVLATADPDSGDVVGLAGTTRTPVRETLTAARDSSDIEDRYRHATRALELLFDELWNCPDPDLEALTALRRLSRHEVERRTDSR